MLKLTLKLKNLAILGVLLTSNVFGSQNSKSIYAADAETALSNCPDGTLVTKLATCGELTLKGAALHCNDKKLFCLCGFGPKKNDPIKVGCSDLSLTDPQNAPLGNFAECAWIGSSSWLSFPSSTTETKKRPFPKEFQTDQECQNATGQSTLQSSCDQECAAATKPTPPSEMISCCDNN
jgi:hypothetical protein